MFTTREPLEKELDTIYKMGFDVWSDGDTLESYFEERRTSPKYLPAGHLRGSDLTNNFTSPTLAHF